MVPVAEELVPVAYRLPCCMSATKTASGVVAKSWVQVAGTFQVCICPGPVPTRVPAASSAVVHVVDPKAIPSRYTSAITSPASCRISTLVIAVGYSSRSTTTVDPSTGFTAPVNAQVVAASPSTTAAAPAEQSCSSAPAAVRHRADSTTTVAAGTTMLQARRVISLMRHGPASVSVLAMRTWVSRAAPWVPAQSRPGWNGTVAAGLSRFSLSLTAPSAKVTSYLLPGWIMRVLSSAAPTCAPARDRKASTSPHASPSHSLLSNTTATSPPVDGGPSSPVPHSKSAPQSARVTVRAVSSVSPRARSLEKRAVNPVVTSVLSTELS
mmetsp:Transcript_9207/g.19896  ORF Transcript_9207/g.19896 Transcript_9207/m.19896 type:complete len:324 (-) Transcript_9207:3482-4453(-)